MTTNGTTPSPTWNQINTAALPTRFVTRLAIDNTKSPNWIYATFGGFNNNNVYVTRDLGTTWTDVSGVTGSATDLPAVPVRSILINPANPNFLYVGTEVGIFASEDAGATWQLPQGGPANVSVDELFLYQGDLMAATHGRGIYTTRAPVMDLPRCVPPPSDPQYPCAPGLSYCRAAGGCCKFGDWECACTWGGPPPTQNDDVAVFCPIIARSNVVVRNLRVDGRLTIDSGSVTVLGDVANFGLIESGTYSGSLTCNNLLNVRPENAVTLRGIISLNSPMTVKGDLLNFGIMIGDGINLNGPAGATQRLGGTGQWNNAYLNIFRTAVLSNDATIDVGLLTVQPFARLRLNGRTLTVNSNSFYVRGTADIGNGTLNVRGNQFQVPDPQNGDTEFGVKGTGTVNLSPTSGTAGFHVSGPPGAFQPSLRIQSGAVNTAFYSSIGGQLIVDPGAVFNFNEGGMTVNGDVTVNGTVSKTQFSISSVLNFNGTTFTNNGSTLIDFIYLNTSGTPRTQTIAGLGPWNGTSFSIGLSGSPSTTSLANDMTFNQSQFLITFGSTLDLRTFNLTYTGSNLLNGGRLIGTGTLIMQPAATASLTGTGTDPFATRIRIASGTVTPSLRASGRFTIDPGAALSNGGLFFMANDVFTNNGSVASTNLTFGSVNFLPIAQDLRGTGTFTGSGQLYVRPESTTTLQSDVTYVGTRIYNEGRINTGAFTLSLPCTTGIEGPGEVIGNMRRTNLAACPGVAFAFGSPFTTIRFTSGTPPTEIVVNVGLFAPVGFPTAAQRTYFITPTGGSGYVATLRLHYLDSELNGNNESSLQLWRNNGTNWTMQGVTTRNTTDNWVEYAGVTQFSPWALSQLAPTAAGVAVSGRVLMPFGAGLPNAVVTMTNSSGVAVSARTSPFGYYRFEDVEVGQVYIITVASKGYTFTPRIITVTDELTGIDFVADLL